MMHYLDTNILIYSSVNQNPAKMDLSQSIVQELFDKINCYFPQSAFRNRSLPFSNLI